ncbi:MAG: glycoside hydrolase family 3 domain protein [Frankiales bacterium]|nr:glycoside hydrolase family 3 domain protein [Frankiales bacterium]
MIRRLLALTLLLCAVGAAPAGAAGPTGDPAGWTDRQLAAQLVLAGYDMGRLGDAMPWVRAGLGGVVLFGRPPADLGSRLARLRASSSVVPLVASDEEGGQVQRLEPLLPALPSAETMGRTRTASQVRSLAASYGRRMRALGVDMDLAPVTDLSVPGMYIEQTDRAFSRTPSGVAAYAGAWQAGMRAARVTPVAKHWPGHGSAANTHDTAATTPPLSTLEQRDLLPFASLMRAGIPAVMVGNLQVPGLTEPGMPATLSPRAYRYLRERAGADRLLVTDSLNMGAIRVGAHLTPAQAAVRALRAGADMVLIDPGGPASVVDAIQSALTSGSYPRSQALTAVRRVLAVKRLTNAPSTPTSLTPVNGSAGASLTPSLTGLARDPVPGTDTVLFYVRSKGMAAWDVANGARVLATTRTRAVYPVPAGRLAPASAYEWRMRTCNDAGRCSAPTVVLTFTTATPPPPSPPPSDTPTASLAQ